MALMVGAAIAGGAQLLGGLLGSSAQKKAAAEKRRLHKQAMGIYGDFMKDPNYSPLRGESMFQNAIGSIGAGFQEAKQNLSMAGSTARQGLRTGAAQTGARMQQSMVSRGLYGTTAYDNAQRGISSDLSRSLASVDENIGQMMAGLATQRGMATAQAQQNLGQFYSQATSQRQNQVENYINLLRDKPQAYNAGAYYGNILGQLGGQAASMMGMGMAGGYFNKAAGGANPNATGYLAPGQAGPVYQ
jgi:hypothetical protein